MLEHRQTFSSLRSLSSQMNLVLLGIAATAAVACSGADVTTMSAELDSEGIAPPALLSPEEREAQFQRLQDEPLSDAERMAVEERLSELGVDLNEVQFSGRLAAIGDSYLDLDSVLGPALDEQGDVEKGRTLAVIDTRKEIDNLPMAPDLFSQVFNGNYQWMRPDISNSVSIVIPDGAAASFLISLFQQAVNNIANAANDCLTTGRFIVRTRSVYDALSPEDKILTKPIFVKYGSLSTTCPLGNAQTTNGCSLYPRKETREFEVNFGQTRLVPGTRIGIVSSKVTSTTTNRLGIVTHELLHTLGLSHPNDSAHAVTVIGTSGSAFTVSVMQDSGCTGSGCLFSNTPTADDIDTIDTLYSQQSSALYPGGDACQWRDGVKNIAAN